MIHSAEAVEPRGEQQQAGKADEDVPASQTLVRYAIAQARERGQRAVLDVGTTLDAPVTLYESEAWRCAESLELHLGEGAKLDLWVYVSPVDGT